MEVGSSSPARIACVATTLLLNSDSAPKNRISITIDLEKTGCKVLNREMMYLYTFSKHCILGTGGNGRKTLYHCTVFKLLVY